MTSKAAHKFKIGTREYRIKLPDVYDNGGGFTMGKALGISKVTESDVADPNVDTIEVGDGIKTGKLLRMKASYKDGTEGDKLKTVTVICPIDKASVAAVDLLNTNYRGNKLTSARVPRRRRLG